MTEILFVAFGSLGDVYPLLAIAKRMQTTHKVTFLANEYFRSYVENAEVNYFPIGSAEDQLAARETGSSTGESLEGRRLRFENIIGKSFKVTYDFIANKVVEGVKLTVVTHGNLSPAVLACEAFDIPIILTHYAPSQIPNNYEDSVLCASFYGKSEWWIRNINIPFQLLKAKLKFEVRNEFNSYRENVGLSPVKNPFENMWKRLLFKKNMQAQPLLKVPLEIVLAPQWFCEPLDKKLSHLKFVGFPFLAESFVPLQQEIESFIQKNGRPIVFTPGTAVEDIDVFVREMIPICRKMAAPGILCSKHGKKIFDQLEKVDDVPLLFVEHANFNHLLPMSRCLIHHGGIGTMAQAIRAGIPQIVRPRMYDQPFNGVRVMMFGLGGSIFPEQYNAHQVANILSHIESSPKHHEFIGYYSDLVRNEDGVKNACEQIAIFLGENNHENAELTASSAAY